MEAIKTITFLTANFMSFFVPLKSMKAKHLISTAETFTRIPN